MLPPLRLCLEPEILPEFPFQIPYEFTAQCFQRLYKLIERFTSASVNKKTTNHVDSPDNQTVIPSTGIDLNDLYVIHDILLNGFLEQSAYRPNNLKNDQTRQDQDQDDDDDYNHLVQQIMNSKLIRNRSQRQRLLRKHTKTKGKKKVLHPIDGSDLDPASSNKSNQYRPPPRRFNLRRNVYSYKNHYQLVANPQAILPMPFSQAYCYSLRIILFCIIAFIRMHNSKSSVILKSFSLMMYLYQHFEQHFDKFCPFQNVFSSSVDNINQTHSNPSQSLPIRNKSKCSHNIVGLWLSHSFLHIFKHNASLSLKQNYSLQDKIPHHISNLSGILSSPLDFLTGFQNSKLTFLQHIVNFWNAKSVDMIPTSLLITGNRLDVGGNNLNILQKPNSSIELKNDIKVDIESAHYIYSTELNNPLTRLGQYRHRLSLLNQHHQHHQQHSFRSGPNPDKTLLSSDTVEFGENLTQFSSPTPLNNLIRAPLAVFDYELDSAFYWLYLTSRDEYLENREEMFNLNRAQYDGGDDDHDDDDNNSGENGQKENKQIFDPNQNNKFLPQSLKFPNYRWVYNSKYYLPHLYDPIYQPESDHFASLRSVPPSYLTYQPDHFLHLCEVNPGQCMCHVQCSCSKRGKHSLSCPLVLNQTGETNMDVNESIIDPLSTTTSHRMLVLSSLCLGIRNQMYFEDTIFKTLKLHNNSHQTEKNNRKNSVSNLDPYLGPNDDPSLIDFYHANLGQQFNSQSITSFDTNNEEKTQVMIANDIIKQYIDDFSSILDIVLQTPLGWLEYLYEQVNNNYQDDILLNNLSDYASHNSETGGQNNELISSGVGYFDSNQHHVANDPRLDTIDDDSSDFELEFSSDDDNDYNPIGNIEPITDVQHFNVFEAILNQEDQKSLKNATNSPNLGHFSLEQFLKLKQFEIDQNNLLFNLSQLDNNFLSKLYQLCPPNQSVLFDILAERAHIDQFDQLVPQQFNYSRRPGVTEVPQNHPTSPLHEPQKRLFQSSLHKTISWGLDLTQIHSATAQSRNNNSWYAKNSLKNTNIHQSSTPTSQILTFDNDFDMSPGIQANEINSSFQSDTLTIKLYDLLVWLSYYTSLPFLLSISHHEPMIYAKEIKQPRKNQKKKKSKSAKNKTNSNTSANTPQDISVDTEPSNRSTNVENISKHAYMYTLEQVFMLSQQKIINHLLNTHPSLSLPHVNKTGMYIFTAQQIQAALMRYRFDLDAKQLGIQSLHFNQNAVSAGGGGGGGGKNSSQQSNQNNKQMVRTLTGQGQKRARGGNAHGGDIMSIFSDNQLWYSPIEAISQQYFAQIIPAGASTSLIKLHVQRGKKNNPGDNLNNQTAFSPYIPQSSFILSAPLPLPPPVHAAKLLSSLFPIFFTTLVNKAYHFMSSNSNQASYISHLLLTNSNNYIENYQPLFPPYYHHYYQSLCNSLFYLRQIEMIKCWYCSLNPHHVTTLVEDTSSPRLDISTPFGSGTNSRNGALKNEMGPMSSSINTGNYLLKLLTSNPTASIDPSSNAETIEKSREQSSAQTYHNKPTISSEPPPIFKSFAELVKGAMSSINTHIKPQIGKIQTQLPPLTSSLQDYFPERISALSSLVDQLHISFEDTIEPFFALESDIASVELILKDLSMTWEELVVKVNIVELELMEYITFIQHQLRKGERGENVEFNSQNDGQNCLFVLNHIFLDKLAKQEKYLFTQLTNLQLQCNTVNNDINMIISCYNTLFQKYIQLENHLGRYINVNDPSQWSQQDDRNGGVGNNGNMADLGFDNSLIDKDQSKPERSFGIKVVDIDKILTTQSQLGELRPHNPSNTNLQNVQSAGNVQNNDQMNSLHQSILEHNSKQGNHVGMEIVRKPTVQHVDQNNISNDNLIFNPIHLEKDNDEVVDEHGDVSFLPKPTAALTRRERMEQQLQQHKLPTQRNLRDFE